jgi:hypothetical protein
MKKYGLLAGLVLCGAISFMQTSSQAQPDRRPVRTLSRGQVEALVRPSLNSCSGQTTGRIETARVNLARVIPTANRRAVPAERIAKTFHGIWRGEVKGDYGDVKVDYFWIFDTRLGEALIIAQRSGRETLARATPSDRAPRLTYLMCSHEGYSPGTNAPQIHEFTKISPSTADGARIVAEATGLKFEGQRATPSQLWQMLVERKYFDSLPYVAFAGALFKPIRIESVPNRTGRPAETFVGWDAEYRGGGSTKLKYVTGIPTIGSERAVFVGTTAQSGDYLLASPGNGSLWKVEAWPATSRRTGPGGIGPAGDLGGGWVVDGVDYSSYYDLAFDSVSMGPLE